MYIIAIYIYIYTMQPAINFQYDCPQLNVKNFSYLTIENVGFLGFLAKCGFPAFPPYVICNLRLFFPYFQKCGDGISKMCQNYDRWNPKLHHMFMVVSNGWWTKSLLGKWLGISKHPFTTGCLGFQVYVWFLKTPCGQKDMPHSKKTQLQPPPEYLTPQALTKATRISCSMCFSSEFPCVLFVVMIF